MMTVWTVLFCCDNLQSLLLLPSNKILLRISQQEEAGRKRLFFHRPQLLFRTTKPERPLHKQTRRHQPNVSASAHSTPRSCDFHPFPGDRAAAAQARSVLSPLPARQPLLNCSGGEPARMGSPPESRGVPLRRLDQHLTCPETLLSPLGALCRGVRAGEATEQVFGRLHAAAETFRCATATGLPRTPASGWPSRAPAAGGGAAREGLLPAAG